MGIFRKAKQFYLNLFRPWSRALLRDWIVDGPGLEVGVGNQTISPPGTILSDLATKYAGGDSIATDMFPGHQIPFVDGHFSYLLSEHVLEHVPDPIEMILEWKRVLCKGGRLFLFLPHPRRTFDRFRLRTTLNHVIEDYAGANSDPEHLIDWTTNVCARGLAPHYDKYTDEELLRDNHLHRHVWLPSDIVQLVEYLGFKMLFAEDMVPDRRDSFVVVAEKE